MPNETLTYDPAKFLPYFRLDGLFVQALPYGCGHINSTYAVDCRKEDGSLVRYIFQRINTDIFEPVSLMQNIETVTAFLRDKIIKAGGCPARETLTILHTKDGRPFYTAADGSCWRAYLFIEDTITFQKADTPLVFYHAAKAFGHFQNLLSDFPAEQLTETIPNFHNTPSRLADLRRAAQRDAAGRACTVQPELAFAYAGEKDASVITDLLAAGRLPIRVTHNDTKLNNILMDRDSGLGLCIVDLDTIMPGSILYDFGDSIRFGASTAAEDEPDLSRVSLDLTLFEAYARGFLEEAGDALTATELDLLAFSAKLITYENGMRFLSDYLDGDTYYSIHRERQNLDRARTQFKLAADMEQKMPQMNTIIKQLRDTLS